MADGPGEGQPAGQGAASAATTERKERLARVGEVVKATAVAYVCLRLGVAGIRFLGASLPRFQPRSPPAHRGSP
jgi:hypothetical protein